MALSDKKEETAKVNPIAQEATAKKAEPNPSKVEAAKKEVSERKAEDKKRKPTHSELMQSMRKQTKTIIDKREKITPFKGKPKSFPSPTFNK